jgi:hypothetical protein
MHLLIYDGLAFLNNLTKHINKWRKINIILNKRFIILDNIDIINADKVFFKVFDNILFKLFPLLFSLFIWLSFSLEIFFLPFE